MELSSLLILGILLLVPPWGFGTFMTTVGKILGWKIKGLFWISSLLFMLILFITGTMERQLLFTEVYIFGYRYNFWGLLPIGLGLLGASSLFVALALRWKYRDKFLQSSENTHSTPSPSHPEIMEKKLPIHELQSTQNRTTPVISSADSDNVQSNIGVSGSKIFISYRRSDSADIAGRIYDRLIGKFGRNPVFKDVDSIPLGLDFKEYLDEQVGKCDVLLAIIGDQWLEASDASGNRRLDNPADFVRIEIESALERNIPVIPLLVRGAQMPTKENLPSSLRKLVYRNGIPIRPDPDFHRDMDRLIKALEKYVK